MQIPVNNKDQTYLSLVWLVISSFEASSCCRSIVVVLNLILGYILPCFHLCLLTSVLVNIDAVALIEIVPCPCSFVCVTIIHVIALIYSTTTLHVGPNPWIIYINPECLGYSFDVKSIFFCHQGSSICGIIVTLSSDIHVHLI